MPIDESTICNAALPQPSELESVEVTECPEPPTYTSHYVEPKPYCQVDFALNR